MSREDAAIREYFATEGSGKRDRIEYALAAADAHDAAHGIHRVSLDDATVERAARALYAHNNPVGNWGGHSARVKKPYRDAARAVLAAAVEAGQ